MQLIDLQLNDMAIERPLELGTVTEETKGVGGSDYEFNPSGCEANKTWWGNEC